MMHRVRNELVVPFITGLPGTSDAPWVGEERARLIVVETVRRIVAAEAALPTLGVAAGQRNCRTAPTPDLRHILAVLADIGLCSINLPRIACFA